MVMSRWSVDLTTLFFLGKLRLRFVRHFTVYIILTVNKGLHVDCWGFHSPIILKMIKTVYSNSMAILSACKILHITGHATV